MNEPSTQVSLSLLLQVDEACLAFEDQWQAGRRPAVEAVLANFPPGDQDSLLAELLLLEWEYRSRVGEALDYEEYARRFPDRRGVVEQAWQRWVERQPQVPSTLATFRGGTEVPPFSEEAAALTLPGYEQIQLLGRGSMGEVFKAFDPLLKRWVALKRVRLDWAGRDWRARFRVEAEALARLGHPHIVQVYGYTESGGRPVLALEYVAGGTLEERLARGRLAPAEAAALVAILAWAVHAAHEKGIVHRDLKPANVLLGSRVAGSSGNVLGGFPKISDFGLAALTDAAGQQTLAGTLLGTPAYMSPEQAAGKTPAVGPPTDVWALGVILYRCLTGVLPFAGGSVLDTLERVKALQMRPPREVCPEVPAGLEEVCLACLRKDPAERPTPAQLAARLEGLSLPVDRPSEPIRQQRPRRRWAVAAGILAASVLIVGIGLTAGWLWRKPPEATNPGVQRTGPLTVNLHVKHYQHVKDADFATAEIGKEFLEMHYNDRVVIQTELPRPAHCFLIACNFNGQDELLWPCDEQGRADRDRPPPPVDQFRYPPGENSGLALDDDKAGGTQAFLVVASGRPLPTYAEWSRPRGPIPWQRLPPLAGVWRSNGTTLDSMKLGGLVVRGHVVELQGQPPLLQLCRWAKGTEAEVMVEALAFPVHPRGVK